MYDSVNKLNKLNSVNRHKTTQVPNLSSDFFIGKVGEYFIIKSIKKGANDNLHLSYVRTCVRYIINIIVTFGLLDLLIQKLLR